MKLFNFFKKESSIEVKSNIQKMDKKQLEKVIGGGPINTTRSNIKTPTSDDGSGDTGVPVTSTTDGTTTYVPTP